MKSISIFSPSSIGRSPLSGLKFSVHSKGKPLHKTNKNRGDILRWSPWDTPKWSSPKCFVGLTHSPSPPPPKKKKTWHNISRHIFHTEHPNMSAFGPFVDLLVSTPWRFQGGHRSWSTIVIGWFLSKHQSQCWTKTTEPTMNWWQKAGWFCECALLINQAHPEAPESTHWIAWEFCRVLPT